VPNRPVRSLVVDNYDSFTHNLVQCLWYLTGTRPTVVTNDDVRWSPEYLAGFDCVVISPGPGRPDRPADFGMCREVIDAVQVPLLGVCLGHQGICHAFGGSVIPAPEPMHGRTSIVRHEGDDLFTGIPSPFLAVRYHSLMVSEIPQALKVIATTDNGITMGLRHRSRPLWGVQFHPESVGTEHGQRLLANFVDLARRTAAGARPARQSPASRPARAADRPPDASPRVPADLRVLTRKVSFPVDAEAVFDAIYRRSKQSFWLDSGRRIGGAGRFSFMGSGTGRRAACLPCPGRGDLGRHGL
jgi:para-aminobenzoate synthetase